jgi:glycerol kinase
MTPVLAIDQGTTSTRALLHKPDGSSEIICAFKHRQHYPGSGRVEHEPEQLIENIQRCIKLGLEQYPDISAIGIDNQGESCLAWNAETRQAISPVIVWQDSRTLSSIEKLQSQGAAERVLELSGLPMDAYFSASKLAWIMHNIPEAHRLHELGTLCLGTTDAFFLHRLTGHFVSDITTASRTSLMNLNTGKWSPELCDLFSVPIDALPEIVATTGDFGRLQSGTSSIPVTASIVDQQASLFGHGCRNAGDAKITFGTGAFALVLTGDKHYRAPQQGLLSTVAWQLENQASTYALDGAVYNAGSAINWAKSLGLFNSFEQINGFSKAPAIERDIAFVPALSGLACPHWDRRAAGLWIGLSLDTTPMDMMQSILEGIAFRAGEVITAMHEFAPIVKTISIDGGLSANPYFCQFLSDLLQRTIRVHDFPELTAIGTAALASGLNAFMPDQNPAGVLYRPGAAMAGHIDKFKQAVELSKNWRSKPETSA